MILLPLYMEFEPKEKYVCLVAPSFVTEYEYPNFVYRLRKLGFDKVMEITFGAKMTNLTYYSILKESIDKGEKKTWIASPCPTIVNFIRVKYPHLVQNLVPVHSPMGCMGLITRKMYPKHKIVFIGPCMTKKMEAAETGAVDFVLTFKELEDIFEKNSIPKVITEDKYMIGFDKLYNDYTKIYPISGGLSETLHYKNLLKSKEILVMEGLNKLMPILEQFKDGVYKQYKFLDILNCDGGCINGPGMISNRSIKERRKRVFKYRDYARRYEKDLGKSGLKAHAEGINFERKF
jgi:iron only hydrogenase large subunit-like protein